MCVYGVYGLWTKPYLPLTSTCSFITFWHSVHLASVPLSLHPAAHHDAMKWFADPQKNTLQYGAAECAISSNLSIRETCSIQFLVAIYSIYSFDIIFDIFGSKILGPSHFHHQRRLQKSLLLLGSSTRSHVAKVISLPWKVEKRLGKAVESSSKKTLEMVPNFETIQVCRGITSAAKELAGYHHPSLSRVFPLGSSWFAHEG